MIDTLDPSCRHRAATQLLHKLSRPFTLSVKVMLHSHDGQSITAELLKNTVPLTGVWNP